MAKKDTRLPNQHPLASLPMTLTTLLLATSIASLFETAHWTLELFAHFRPQYLCGAAGLFVLTLLTKQHTACLANLVLLGVNGWFVGNYLLNISPSATPNDSHVGLTMIHANVGWSQRIDLLLNSARKERADVILIQELNAIGMQTIAAEPDYPHRYLHPQQDEFGIGIISQIPLQVELQYGPSGLLPFLVAKIPWGEAPLNLFYLHPPPPVSAHMSDLRNKLMDTVALRVRQTPNAFVVGDLNNTPWTQSFAKFVSKSEIRPIRPAGTLIGTWPVLSEFTNGWPLMIQIDHLLTRQATDIVDFRTLASIESDHLPLMFKLTAQ